MVPDDCKEGGKPTPGSGTRVSGESCQQDGILICDPTDMPSLIFAPFRTTHRPGIISEGESLCHLARSRLLTALSHPVRVVSTSISESHCRDPFPQSCRSLRSQLRRWFLPYRTILLRLPHRLIRTHRSPFRLRSNGWQTVRRNKRWRLEHRAPIRGPRVSIKSWQNAGT